jgi:hypothetical protein
VTAFAQDRSRIDDFLPTHDFSAAYEIRINAPPSLVYQCLLRSDFNKPWLVQLLMTIRTGKRPPPNRVPGDLPKRLQGTGFVILDDVPGEELAIGVAGKFWRPDGGRCLDLTASDDLPVAVGLPGVRFRWAAMETSREERHLEVNCEPGTRSRHSQRSLTS